MVADTVVGKMGTYDVIFVGTNRGVIRKMLNLQPVEKEPCLIEEIKVTPNGDFKPIKQLRISKEHVSLDIQINEMFESSNTCIHTLTPAKN